jgi:hypothetical protein
MKNLTIALMSGYKDFTNIKVFISSIAKIHTDIHVLYKDVGTDIIDNIKKFYPNVKLVDYSSYYIKYKINTSLSIYNVKYFIIYLYIKYHLKDQYDYILLSDINDVYVQSDPFKTELNDINLFAEKLKIGQCITNALWYAQCYGYKQLSIDYDKPIINNGVIIIKHSDILLYLKLFVNELQSIIIKSGAKQSDQAVATYCYNNYFFDWRNVTLHLMPNNTCAHLAQDVELNNIFEAITIRDNKIYYNNLLPSIIHQYNRYSKLNDILST